MARKILVAYDFSQLEALQFRLQNLASAPSTPVVGQGWFDTTANRPIFRGSAGNLDLTARANHTGTQTASTISDFDIQVRSSSL
ncbi:MAG: hypothetical protein RL456_1653, partial [Pseudomonadota bacterium]